MPSTSASTQPAQRGCAILFSLVILLATSAASRAAEISVLSASALKVVVAELAQEFRRESGHTPKLGFATAGEVERRVLANEAVDVIIATDVQMGRLAEKGLVVASSRAIIASVGVGVGVKDGAQKPDISNAAALKATLLAAKSVTYPDPAKGGASGIHFAAVMDKLGIAEAIKPKAILGANPDFVCVAVAKGEAELCVHQISEIMPVKGVTLVGPLPRELQKVTTFVVAAAQAAPASEAALAFAQFVARPALKARFAAAGLDYKID
jgi:molybdate transport system substrate-binding protein